MGEGGRVRDYEPLVHIPTLSLKSRVGGSQKQEQRACHIRNRDKVELAHMMPVAIRIHSSSCTVTMLPETQPPSPLALLLVQGKEGHPDAKWQP